MTDRPTTGLVPDRQRWERPWQASRPGSGEASPGRGVSDHTWGAVIAVVLCGLVPVWLLASTRGSAGSPVWPWALVVVLLAGGFYAYAVSRGRRRLYELTFWLFTYVFMGLAPLVQLRTGTTPGTTPDTDPQLDLPAVAVVLVGVLAWLAGTYVSRITRRITGSAARTSGIATAESTPRVYALSFFLLAAAVWYVLRIGPSTLFSNRTELFAVQASIWTLPGTGAVFVNLCTIALIVPIAALHRISVRRRAAGGRVLTDRLLIGVMTVVLLVVMNPIANPRYQFGTVAFALAAVFGVVSSKTRFRLFAIGMVVLMVAVFPYADRFRYQAGDTAQSKGGVVQALTSGDYDAYDQINNTLAYTRAHGTTHGQQALGVALFWVPRSVWPSKAQDTGVLLAGFRGYGFTNLSAPIWAELFINGGWWAVMAGMGVLGWAARRADDLTTDWAFSPSPLGYVLPFYMIIVYRGSLLQAVATLSVLVALGLAVRVWPGSGPAPELQAPPGAPAAVRPTNPLVPIRRPGQVPQPVAGAVAAR